MTRSALLLLAAVALVVAVAHAREDRGCRAAQRDAFAIGIGNGGGIDPARVAADAQDACSGGTALAFASTGLLRGGKVDAAATLAREASSRDPDDYRGWLALANVLEARGNAAGAAAARARVRALSPPRPAPG